MDPQPGRIYPDLTAAGGAPHQPVAGVRRYRGWDSPRIAEAVTVVADEVDGEAFYQFRVSRDHSGLEALDGVYSLRGCLVVEMDQDASNDLG